MIKITVDIFSGRPNPTWLINDDRGEELLKQIASYREIVSTPQAGYDGLGYRGVTIEQFSDEPYDKLPGMFSIANGALENQKTSLEIARKIVDQMLRYEKFSYDIHRITPIDANIQKIIKGSIDFFEQDLKKIQEYIKIRRPIPSVSPIRVTVNDPKCTDCKYEESRYNPNFWNADNYVMRNNNCYNYGRNWKTNTFAQPGRFSGMTASSMSCSDVKAAAMRDGLVERCDCLLASEYPRRLMALVIAPGIDYHWYRKQKSGFWGHKPGPTAARNIDNSGVVITNPETCDRGAGTYLNYTNFCGYFYAGKSVIIS